MYEFSPREVKLAVTGFGGADKDQVATIIKRLFPTLLAPEKMDVTDALAVTLCCLWNMKGKAIATIVAMISPNNLIMSIM